MTEIVFKKDWVVIPKLLDESTTVSDEIPTEGKLAIDFQNLRQINSYGTRLLIQFVRNHAHQEQEFHRCPTPLIEAINIVRDLLGPNRDSRIVKSFEMPYECESCRQTKSIFVNTSDFDPDNGGFQHAAPICTSCGEPMDLEIDEADYLEFMSQQR